MPDGTSSYYNYTNHNKETEAPRSTTTTSYRVCVTYIVVQTAIPICIKLVHVTLVQHTGVHSCFVHK
jgi:hypothetical protein